LAKEDIGILIHASVCRDFLEPATASVVHAQLELSKHCMIMDVSNACLGVLSSFLLVANMIEQGVIKAGLIVSGENSAPLVEETIKFLNSDSSINRKSIKKYFANLTIGSAGVAYILAHQDYNRDGHKILGGASMTKSDANKLCQGDGNANSLMMQTDSEELLHAGLELAEDTWQETKSILQWKNDTPDFFITHQVGKAHEQLTFDRLNISLDKAFANYPTLGNTGSAALPTALSQLADSGKLRGGEYLALLGIGSGLSSTMLGVKW
jgi:3-oxoacyl-[acyl-carrier-protein] synthase-3